MGTQKYHSKNVGGYCIPGCVDDLLQASQGCNPSPANTDKITASTQMHLKIFQPQNG